VTFFANNKIANSTLGTEYTFENVVWHMYMILSSARIFARQFEIWTRENFQKRKSNFFSLEGIAKKKPIQFSMSVKKNVHEWSEFNVIFFLRMKAAKAENVMIIQSYWMTSVTIFQLVNRFIFCFFQRNVELIQVPYLIKVTFGKRLVLQVKTVRENQFIQHGPKTIKCSSIKKFKIC